MADLKDCKKYATCDWRKSVGYCPEECNHFKHKDEVVVTRCRECKKDWCYLRRELGEDGFCSAGERKDHA